VDHCLIYALLLPSHHFPEVALWHIFAIISVILHYYLDNLLVAAGAVSSIEK
jgi:hypothetical protein